VIAGCLFFPSLSAHGRQAQKIKYGFGFAIDVPAPESEVLQAVAEVADDGIIQGTKEYNKDQYVEGALEVRSSPLFAAWTGPGKVFYKVRSGALAPVNFKESSDQGTLAVRYVVQGEGPTQTLLRIDAVFVEDFRRTTHASNGSVESAEYKDIQQHIDAMELNKRQTQETEESHQQDVARQVLVEAPRAGNEVSRLAAAQSSGQTLEEQVTALRRQVERRAGPAGAQLKSAPFKTATTLKPLSAGTEVVILIVTPYWLGVETSDGQHGWINMRQLEPLP
jgi:hypothetical protein